MSIRNLYIVVVALTASKNAKFWCENGNLSQVNDVTLSSYSSAQSAGNPETTLQFNLTIYLFQSTCPCYTYATCKISTNVCNLGFCL
jgi:hypothetical protein